METKICKNCSINKTFDEFYKRKDSKDGYRNICKICDKKKLDDWVKINPDKIKKQRDNWRLENAEKKKENDNKYRVNNREKEQKRLKEYYKNNSIKVKENHKKWREKNKYKIAFRSLLRNSLVRLGKEKENKTIELLGYSVLDLKEHMENLFTEGMSWDNYGEWHIDHIVGIVNFDSETPQSIVNALSNLRPLWATTREINGVIYEGNLNRPKF